MAEAISLTFTAELGKLRRQLAEAGNLTERQIRGLTVALEREQQRQTAALRSISTAGARETQRAAREAEQAVESRRRGLQQIAALALGDQVNDLGDLGEGLVDVGVAAEAAGVAVAGVVGIAGGLYLSAKAIDLTAGTAFRLAAGAQEAYEHLEKFKKIPGLLPKIDRADLRAVNELPAALQAVSLLAENAALQIGAKLAPSFRTAAVVAVAAGLAFNDFLSTSLSALGRIGEWYDKLSPLAKAALQVVSPIPGLIASLENLGGSLADGSSAFGDYGKRADELVGSLTKLHAWEVRGAAAAEASAQAAAEAATAYAAAASAVQALVAIQVTAGEDVLSASDALAESYGRQQIEAEKAYATLVRAHEDEIAALRRQGGQAAEVAAAQARAANDEELHMQTLAELRERYTRDSQRLAIEERKTRIDAAIAERDVIRQAALDALDARIAANETAAQSWQILQEAVGPYTDAVLTSLSAVDQLAAHQLSHHQAELERLRSQRAEWRALVKAKIGTYREGRDEMDATDRAAAEAEIARLQAGRDRYGEYVAEQIRDQKRAARTAWAIQKAAAISTAAIQAGLAVLQVMASVPAPAWPVAIPAAAVLGATQVTLIAAEPPPKFHTGRSPDETPAMLTRGEAVLTPRAVAAMGGARSVDAANRGEMDGGGGGGVIVVALNDRVLDVAMARTLRVGRAVGVELRRLGRSPGGRGGYR